MVAQSRIDTGMFGPFAVLLLLAALTMVLGRISDDPHRHGRPGR